MKTIRIFALMLMTVATCAVCITSCKREDDLSEIFEGKTWYITSAYIQGRPLGGNDLKTFYASETAFLISFGKETFTGTLSDGNTFSGTWEANGKTQQFHLNIQNEAMPSATLDRFIYNTLKRAVRYEGDANILKLYEDDANFISLSSKRSPESVI
ncbi:MAG: DUF4847 family protein [Bacteroidaceae bacterium]|nr:DUF4847 family protein [Bacteroidaceae bacterium]